jgi:hypothetical protein
MGAKSAIRQSSAMSPSDHHKVLVMRAGRGGASGVDGSVVTDEASVAAASRSAGAETRVGDRI